MRTYSLVSQAVRSIKLTFNIIFREKVKNDGKEEIMLKMSLIERTNWFTALEDLKNIEKYFCKYSCFQLTSKETEERFRTPGIAIIFETLEHLSKINKIYFSDTCSYGLSR